jgi:hypothetical protein
MVSLSARRVLRLHRGYAWAPDRVLRALVQFLDSRLPRALRRLAEREFLAFPVEQHASAPPRVPRRERPRPGDLLVLHRLAQATSGSMSPISAAGSASSRSGCPDGCAPG